MARSKLEIAFWIVFCGVLLLISLILFAAHSNPPGHSLMPRTNIEVRALSSAIENYKIDTGSYPGVLDVTERLEPDTSYNPAAYVESSAGLYRALSGELTGNTASPDEKRPKCYFEFPAAMIRTSKTGHKYIVDQWGNSYGYSTFETTHPTSHGGHNPTFDLWSTGGGRSAADKSKWITNW